MKKQFNLGFGKLAVMLMFVMASAISTAGALSDYAEAALVNHTLRGTAYTAPATTYLRLNTSACTDSSAGTEATYTGYARAAITSNTTNWSAPGTDGTVSNTATVTIGAANSGSTQTVTHAVLMDASTGGNMIWCQALGTSRTINTGDPAPYFPAGSINIWIDQ